ncbi:Stf0 family sulfotransferase [Allochromatium tepidum]|uniref:Radical SAM core domain-containing protein n=1 Tax=Allochromatium tepidum TaxID=553982 RepID=A0ABM7QJ19_9GAMM|nr:Stf0 family sulfotransferase [Allochromatium tepidum]BCU05743.1 hypothetical protein Atep_04200 [Allochromatium tepidum]
MTLTRNDLPDWWPRRLASIERFAAWAEGGAPPDAPLELFLEISNLCDLKCAMCPTFSGLSPSRLYSIKEQERGLLDLDALRPNLESILQQVINVHCFGYGEPTLHGRFVELLRDLGAYRVLIDFFTNGMHLDQALCEALVEQRVFSLTVSASGVEAAEYEQIYLGGRFETLLAGLRRLDACKRAHGSRYPRVEVNSIAFEHHVRRLPEFVDLMADHGVEVIHLKTLQTFETTRELRGHRSILRPWIEEPILHESEQRARARGLILSTDQYRQTQVGDERAWQAARGDVAATLPLSALAEAARTLKPSRPPPGHAADDRVDARHLSPEDLEQVFTPITPEGPAPFYCFEPFKTLYVRRSGHTKPCCFADDSGPSLGNLMEAEASAIWQGRPFQRLREGILTQRYPRSLCAHCLKDGYGPRRHDIPDRLAHYRDWLESAWGYRLPLSIPTTTLTNEEIVQRRREDSRADESRRRLLDEVRRLTPFGVPQTLLEGHLDGVIEGALHGWVRAPGMPGLRLSVSLSLDGRPWRDIRADRFREDLAAAGKGDGRYAFRVELADVPSPATIEVRLTDTDRLLGRLQYGDTEPLRAPEHSEARTEIRAPELEPAPFLLDYDPGIHEREILRYFASRAAGRPRPAPPHRDRQPDTVLVIAFSNRSGSNLLAEALAASGLVNRAREAFNFDRIIDTCEQTGLNDLAGYLDHLNPAPEEPPALAVKLSWDQLFFLRRVGVIPYYWPRVEFAWILRDDLMAQALSYLVAERTGGWSGAYPEHALTRALAELTPEDLVRKLEEITWAHRQFAGYFALYGIEPVIVDYDELAADPEGEAHRVLDRLGMIPNGRPWRFDRSAITSRRQRTPAMEATLRRLKNAIRGG